MQAVVRVELEFAAPMERSLQAVLEGEYDAPFVGEALTILDIGANVGAFSIWANLRWPRSTIHAYEPQPDTFDMLVRNVAHLPNVHCEQVAVYPSERATEPLISTYAGDGEAGLVDALAPTWRTLPRERVREVPVRAPGELPAADIVKVDAEGSEAAIIEGLRLERTALLLLEYQNRRNLERILSATRGRFRIVRHDSHPWWPLLRNAEYRRELRGDRYGTIVLAQERDGSLRHSAPPSRVEGTPERALRAAARAALRRPLPRGPR